MNDPRDAALAADFAAGLQRVRWFGFGWALPRRRPQGRRRWLWLTHLAVTLAGVVFTIVQLWPKVHSPWRWVFVALLVYSVISMPLILGRVLRAFWNAPEAERKNRELTHGT